MEENVDVASPASSVIPESEVNNQIIEEGSRICPLCSSEIRLFLVNYHEKFLMCENTECEFPFGYEELQFVRYENAGDNFDVQSVSGQAQAGQSLPGSHLSTSGWSDIDKISRLCESVTSPSDPKSLDNPPKKAKYKNRISKRQKEKQMQKNLEDLKGLTLELNNITKSRTTIKNEKWINNLMYLQDMSGLKLLEPLENKIVVNKERASELNIDIEPGNSGCTSSIKIKISNQNMLPKKL